MLTQRYDLGNMTQAIYNSAHGHLLEVTEVGGEQVSRLGIHVDPILVAFAPLWWVWPSPLMLLIVQALALALGALPVFWLTRKHLESARAGAMLALVYLLYPPLEWNVIREFHAVSLAVPLLLFAIWFLDERRMLPFALCATAALLTKEQIGLMIAVIGLWHAARMREWRVGMLITTAGAAWSALAITVVIPHFAGGPSPYQARYQSIGGDPAGVLRTVVTDPEKILQPFATTQNLGLLILLALPVLGICLLSPLVLAAAPQLALSMLSERAADNAFVNQNSLPLVPVIIAATVFGAARIAKRPNFLALNILVSAAALAMLLGPVSYFGSLGQHKELKVPPNHLEAQRTALALIPATAPVSATNRLGGHLAERRYVYVFPAVERAHWIAVDTYDTWLPTRRSFSNRDGLQVGVRDGFLQPERVAQLVADLKKDPTWSLVFERSGVLVFRRA